MADSAPCERVREPGMALWEDHLVGGGLCAAVYQICLRVDSFGEERQAWEGQKEAKGLQPPPGERRTPSCAVSARCQRFCLLLWLWFFPCPLFAADDVTDVCLICLICVNLIVADGVCHTHLRECVSAHVALVTLAPSPNLACIKSGSFYLLPNSHGYVLKYAYCHIFVICIPWFNLVLKTNNLLSH